MIDTGVVVGLLTGGAGLIASGYAWWLADRRSAASRDRAKVVLSKIGDDAEAISNSVVIGGVHFGAVNEAVEVDTRARIDRLVHSLHESQRLITELQDEINVKAAAVARLQAEEEQSRHLAALREEEAAAVNKLINSTLTAAHDKLRRRLEDERDDLRTNLALLQDELTAMQQTGRRDQWRFFGAGVLLSIPIGIMINVLF